jgi:hypothetical protein
MPPVAGNKHGLARVLNALNPIWNQTSATRSLCLFKSWQNEVKVLDCFVVFTFVNQMLASHQILVYVRTGWNQQPPLTASDARVPCRGA